MFDPQVYQIRPGTWSDVLEVIRKLFRSIQIGLPTNLGHLDGKKALRALNIARISRF